jgi:ferritin-like metal-binding protein YciE
MADLDGTWTVERVSGALPPLAGVRKRIAGSTGETKIGRLIGVPFVVEGLTLRYRRPLDGLVDYLEPDGDGYAGRTVYQGRELGRFRMRLIETGGAMASEDVRNQLVKHIDEAIAMEESVKRLLDGMIQTTDDPQIIDLLEHHKLETEQHSQRLRRRLSAHGASPSMVREATGILGALAKLPLDLVRGDKAGRNARDGYATEHMEVAAYELLERVAIRAGDEETAHVARQNRQEERDMARRLEERWDRFAELALAEAGATTSAAS